MPTIYLVVVSIKQISFHLSDFGWSPKVESCNLQPDLAAKQLVPTQVTAIDDHDDELAIMMLVAAASC